MRRHAVLIAVLSASLLECGGGSTPVSTESGAIDVYVTNGTQATIMAGIKPLFFLAPGEETLALHTEMPIPDDKPSEIWLYDWVENRPVPFLVVSVVARQLPASGACSSRVTVTRTNATADGRCSVVVASVRTVP